jgi:phage tail protein X
VVTQAGDTLRSVAQRVYGDSSLWYVIAEENGYTNPDAVLAEGLALRVPNQLVNMRNTSEVFRPFNTSAAIGDTSPTFYFYPNPEFKEHHCSTWAMIAAAIVLIVLEIVLPEVPWFKALFAGLGSAAPTVTAMAASAVANAAAQLTTIAIDGGKFDWTQVAMAAISAGVAQNIPAINLSKGLTGASKWGAKFLEGAIRSAETNAITQGIGVLTGLQKSFSWRDVMISGITGGVTRVVGDYVAQDMLKASGDYSQEELNAMTDPQAALNKDFATQASLGFVTSIASSAVNAAMGGKVDTVSILTDSFAQGLGNFIAGRIHSAPPPPPVLPAAFGSTSDTGSSAAREDSLEKPAVTEKNAAAVATASPERLQEIIVSAKREGALKPLITTVSDLQSQLLFLRPRSIFTAEKASIRRFYAAVDLVDNGISEGWNALLFGAAAQELRKPTGDITAQSIAALMLADPQLRPGILTQAGLTEAAVQEKGLTTQQIYQMISDGSLESMQTTTELAWKTQDVAGGKHASVGFEANLLDSIANNFEGSDLPFAVDVVKGLSPYRYVDHDAVMGQIQMDLTVAAAAHSAGFISSDGFADIESRLKLDEKFEFLGLVPLPAGIKLRHLKKLAVVAGVFAASSGAAQAGPIGSALKGVADNIAGAGLTRYARYSLQASRASLNALRANIKPLASSAFKWLHPFDRGWQAELDVLKSLGSKFHLGSSKTIDYFETVVDELTKKSGFAVTSIKSIDLTTLTAKNLDAFGALMNDYMGALSDFTGGTVWKYLLEGAENGTKVVMREDQIAARKLILAVNQPLNGAQLAIMARLRQNAARWVRPVELEIKILQK